MPVETEAENNQDANQAEPHTNNCAETTGGALRTAGGCEPPFTKKIPDADAEMKRRCQDTQNHEGERPGILHLQRDVLVGRFAVGKPPFSVQMPTYVGESEGYWDTLDWPRSQI